MHNEGTGVNQREGADVNEGDKYADRRKLVAAGWEPKDRKGTVIWRSPRNGYWYPQNLAIDLLRDRANADATEKPEGTV